MNGSAEHNTLRSSTKHVLQQVIPFVRGRYLVLRREQLQIIAGKRQQVLNIRSFRPKINNDHSDPLAHQRSLQFTLREVRDYQAVLSLPSPSTPKRILNRILHPRLYKQSLYCVNTSDIDINMAMCDALTAWAWPQNEVADSPEREEAELALMAIANSEEALQKSFSKLLDMAVEGDLTIANLNDIF